MFLSKYAVARHIYIPIVKRAVVDFAVGADWTPAAGDVKISIDGAGASNVTNLPVAIVMGNTAIWDFSLTSGEVTGKQIVVTVADAATKAVEDQTLIIETYGNASAQHPFDLGTASTAQTGDNYARLGAPAGASIAADIAEVEVETDDIAAIKTKTDQLVFTVANQADVNVVDWKGAVAPAMTGDAFARLGAPVGASISADIAAIKADTATILTDVNTGAGAIYTRLGAPAGASLAADLAEIEAETDTLTGFITATPPTAATIATAVWAVVIDGTNTALGMMRGFAAALLGKASGMGGTNPKFRNIPDAKDVIDATCDADGNRIVVTLDLS